MLLSSPSTLVVGLCPRLSWLIGSQSELLDSHGFLYNFLYGIIRPWVVRTFGNTFPPNVPIDKITPLFFNLNV